MVTVGGPGSVLRPLPAQTVIVNVTTGVASPPSSAWIVTVWLPGCAPWDTVPRTFPFA